MSHLRVIGTEPTRKESLQRAASGKAPVTAAILLHASRASELSINDPLSVPVPADRCRACGQIKRVSSCAA